MQAASFYQPVSHLAFSQQLGGRLKKNVSMNWLGYRQQKYTGINVLWEIRDYRSLLFVF